MEINIKQEELVEAKRLRDTLDSIKTYDKFKCSGNYIGPLGEVVLHRYLEEHNIKHEWKDFIGKNKGFNEPDFIIDGRTVDLKTTRGVDMWFQSPRHDIYVHARINEDDTVLTVDGFLTAEQLRTRIKNNIVKVVTRGTRQDYIISPMDMMPVVYLIKGGKEDE